MNAVRVEVGYAPLRSGGEVVVARVGPLTATERVAEVGAPGSRVRELARRAASSRALRTVAKTALGVARATPYGRAASSALRVARSATRAARRPERPASAPARTAPLAASTLTDTQRVELARRLLGSRMPAASKLVALAEVLDDGR